MVYMGHHIYKCERVKGAHSGSWIVQTYHHTGMPLADEECPHYPTLAAAKAAIKAAA